jgi:hypothetical protein
MEVSGHLKLLAAYSEKAAHGMHCMGGWVGPRVSPDAMKSKISSLPNSSLVQCTAYLLYLPLLYTKTVPTLNTISLSCDSSIIKRTKNIHKKDRLITYFSSFPLYSLYLYLLLSFLPHSVPIPFISLTHHLFPPSFFR